MIFTGFQIMMSRMMDARKIFVVGISLIFGLSVDLLPGVYSQIQHPWLHPIFSSSLSLATLLAVVLTLIFRIGISRQQRLVLEPGRGASESIFSFMERQGAAWGARKDVVYRAVSALNEAVESISAQSLARGNVTVDVSFDELNLDLAVEYDGEPLLMPERPPLEPELLSDEDAVSWLSAYLISRYADRVDSSCRDGRCRLLLHFDH
jgi:NCS2 family nucleobase:cation symporter-2